MKEYLASSRWIDPDDAGVQSLVAERGWRTLGEVDAARAAFHFVRDEVHHSWDIKSHRVTRTASEALVHREGLCFSKAMLLAALFRALGLPAGLAYQRLTFGDTPDTGFSLHGFTTVYLASAARWVRLDARGNKAGVDAQFSLDGERLAFPVRPQLGERDFPWNLAEPHPAVAAALDAHDDLHVLIERLPDAPDAG